MTLEPNGRGTALESPTALKNPSILDKCSAFSVPDELKARGMYPYHRIIQSGQDTEVMVNGRPMLML